MNNIIETLMPYEGATDLPDDVKQNIKDQLKQKLDEADAMSDEYDKYQEALQYLSRLGVHIPKAKPYFEPPSRSTQYFSTVNDLINALK